MSTPIDAPRSSGRRWLSVLGWVWTLLLVVGLALIAYKMTPRDALDLGEDGFGYFMVFGVPLLVLLPITVLTWLITGIARFVSKRADRWVPWIRLGMVVMTIVAIIATRTLRPSVNPITPESEPGYLALASAAREQMKGSTWKEISLDPDPNRFSKGDFPDSVAKRLDSMVPAYWPRYLLRIWADDHCVILARGSGMLGMVGIRIYDHGPVVSYSEEELRKNPYLPCQTRITDRIWFFTSE